MERIRGIDTIRGACMFIMIYGHMVEWWLRPEDYWFREWLFAFFESIGATGFLFVSGVSAALAFRSNKLKLQGLKNFNMLIARNAYFLRAFFILLVGFGYNFFVTRLWGGNITDLWSWLVLQTIGFSLILSWPFLGSSRNFRIILGIIILIVNQLILLILFPYKGEPNFYGVLYYLLFNPLSQYPILAYFSIFLMGTALGDKIFELNIVKSQEERRFLFKNKLLIPLFLIGTITLIFGMIFPEFLIFNLITAFSEGKSLVFPPFLTFNTISAFAYSLGIILIVLAIFMAIQIFNRIKTKKSFRYLFFYSYYSFTIYLAHNILYFLFVGQLTCVTIWIPIIVGSIIFGFLFRTMYIKLGSKASLKSVIGKISFGLAMKFYKNKTKY